MKVDTPVEHLDAAIDLFEASFTHLHETPPQLTPTRREVFGIVVGLLHQCREYIKVMVLLAENGVVNAGAPTVRSCMEFACTGMWLLRDPEKNLEDFYKSYRRHARLLGDEMEVLGAILPTIDQVMDKTFGHHDEGRLPGVEQRLGDVKMYVQYRTLCEFTHPTLGVAIRTLSSGMTGKPGEPHSTNFVLQTAMWTWMLTLDVSRAFGVPKADPLHSIGDRIQELFGSEAQGMRR